jgi:ketosteroid isomerase-like protein
MSATATEVPTTSAASAIAAFVEPWARACIAKDWDTLLTFCTDDVVFSPPNGQLVQHETVRPFLDGFPTIATMAWDIDHRIRRIPSRSGKVRRARVATKGN